MKQKKHKGSITVFLSLLCIIMLCCIFAIIESARVQGAKTRSANITGMGTFSVMGEYENKMLDKYDIFSFDGSFQTGALDMEKVNSKMKDYISYNVNPKKDLKLNFMYFDPWNLEMKNNEITEYALLTDENGLAFYKQATDYMKTTGIADMLDGAADMVQEALDMQTDKENYEELLKSNTEELKKQEEARKRAIEEQKRKEEEERKQAEEAGIVLPPRQEVEEKCEVENPLPVIAQLRKLTPLGIVHSGSDISEKEIELSELPSKKVTNKGTMEQKKARSIINDGLFREYLLIHFSNFVNPDKDAALEYQMEYIICGKKNDHKNINWISGELLALREGLNFVFLCTNAVKAAEADAMAGVLCLGFAPAILPLKYALSLAWAYGESLIDVKMLLHGGKVPIVKTEETWQLDLSKLIKIKKLLEKANEGGGSGQSYTFYLRILLYTGSIKKQIMRALDLIELQMKKEIHPSFKAENCIVGIKAKTEYFCHPLFLNLPKAMFGINYQGSSFVQESSIAY